MIHTKISGLGCIPMEVRRAFAQASEPQPGEETLWREVVARMVMDAMGITGLQNSEYEHKVIVRDAREWWEPRYDTDRSLSFELAGMFNMKAISEAMRKTEPIEPKSRKRKDEGPQL